MRSLKSGGTSFRTPLYLFICTFLIGINIAYAGVTFVQGAPLSKFRVDAASSLLPDGRVFVMGGNDGFYANKTTTNTTEIFDPNTNTWTSATSMSTKRFNHMAVALNNGKVLVTGGQDNNTHLSSSEIYDAQTDTWTTAASTNVRYNLGEVVKLTDGRVLIAGGGFSDQSTEIYDPSADRWTYTAEMINNHGGALTLTLLNNGKVLAVGGTNSRRTAELFDPKTDTWSLVADSTLVDRSYHSAVKLANGNVLITGGNLEQNSEIFNVSTQKFESLATTNRYTNDCQSVLLDNGNVLIYALGDILNTNTESLELYNTSTNTWETLNTSFTGAQGYIMEKMHDGRILFGGGLFTTGNGGTNAVILVSQTGYGSCIQPNTNNVISTQASCLGNDHKLTITNSEVDVKYSVFSGDVDQRQQASGNGGNLELTVPADYTWIGNNTFQVRATKAGCMASILSNTGTVNVTQTVTDRPSLTIIKGALKFCDGDTMILKSTSHPTYSLLWNTGATSDSIVVTEKSLITSSFIDATGCLGPKSDTIIHETFTYNDLIVPSFGPMCITDSALSLGKPQVNGYWDGPGVTNNIFTPTMAGTGNHKVTYHYCNFSRYKYIRVSTPKNVSYLEANINWGKSSPLCGGVYDEVYLNNTSTSEKYTISVNDHVIHSGSGPSYNWLRETYIPGDTTVSNLEVMVVATSPTGCPNDTVVYQKSKVIVPKPAIVDFALPDSACVGNPIDLVIRKPENNVYYIINGTDEKLSKGEDSLVFTFPFTSQWAQYYEIIAENSLRCKNSTEIEDNARTITYFPIANFDIDDVYNIGDSVKIINTSNGNNYSWDVNGSVSNNLHPNPLVFNAVGSYPVTLISESKWGCSDTTTKFINLVQVPQGLNKAFNLFDTVQSNLVNGFDVYMTHTDRAGNHYAVGANFNFGAVNGYHHVVNWFVEKFDQDGKHIWKNEQSPDKYWTGTDYYSTIITAITSDDDGNLYLTGSYAASELDVADTTITYPNGTYNHGFIMRINSDGTMPWFLYTDDDYNTQKNGYPRGGSDIKFIGDKIYVFMTKGIKMFDVHGNYINNEWSQNRHRLMVLDKDANLINEYFFNPNGQSKDMDYTYYNTGSYTSDSQVATTGPSIVDLGNDKVAIVGHLKENFSIGNYSLTKTTKNTFGYFSAVVNLQTGQWDNAMMLGSYALLGNPKNRPACTTNNSHDIITALSSKKTDYAFEGKRNMVQDIDGKEHRYDNEDITLLSAVSVNGMLKWKKIIKNTLVRSLDFDAASNTVIAFGKYKGDFAFDLSDKTFGVKGNDVYNNFIAGFDGATGAVKWFEKIGSAKNDIPHYAHLSACGSYTLFGGFKENYDSATTVTYKGSSVGLNTARNYILSIDMAPSSSSCNPLSKNSIENVEGLLVFPNPTQGSFTVQIDKIPENNVLIVTDVAGRFVLRQQINSFTTQVQIDAKAGVYFITLDGQVSTLLIREN